MLTIQERFGKKPGLNVTFVGDGNNVAVSLMHVCAKLGWNFTLASPEGYELNPVAMEIGRKIALETGSRLAFLHDPHQAVRAAQVIYTDTWTSMGQEAETARRERDFAAFQVNNALVAQADPEAIVMHCLPAHRNHELTDEVADGPHSVIFPQAHNRLHAQKAILARVLGVA